MGKALYVGNLLFSATAGDLRHLFGRCGTVKTARVVADQIHQRKERARESS